MAAIAIAAMVGATLALAGMGFAAWVLYGGFGPSRAEANTLAWSERQPIYAISDCGQCHPQPATAATPHAALLCETCHVPTVVHPGSVPGVVQALPASTSATCIACHGKTAGRPAGFPQVDPGRHYETVDCLRCHDPHTTTAQRPPEVTHPLTNLPSCTTCHAPGGLKRFPEGHQPAADSVCLACHLPARREP